MPEDGITIEIKGLDELNAKLDQLSQKEADAAIRKALRAGAAIEQAAIIDRAPVKVDTGGTLPEGALRADIVVKMTRDEQGNFAAIVGPDKLTRHVARWVEYGHRLVRDGKSRLLANGKTRGFGKEVGAVPEHPFIRPAFEATAEEVAQTIASTLAAEIEKAANNK